MFSGLLCDSAKDDRDHPGEIREGTWNGGKSLSP